jgi:FlaA1/EpsC-like NDP-sugar epimerase
MIKFFLNLNRRTKQLLMVFFDSIAIIICLFAAFAIRLGYFFYPVNDIDLLMTIYASPILALPIFTIFGFYHNVIRYLGLKSIWRFTQGASVYAICWGLIIFMGNIEFIPRSVVLINWLLIIIFVGGSRLLLRAVFLNATKLRNILIYGAGSAGRQLSTALNELNEYNLVGFIDDSKDLHRNTINGLRVYSQDELKELVQRKNIKEVLLALPSVSRIRRTQIIDYLNNFPIVVRAVPGLSELIQGKVEINNLLKINLDDLLGRASAKANTSILKKNISKKVVLITGAGGSIGSELSRQILFLKPEKIILYDISESSLYQIEQELSSINSFNIDIYAVIGSILNKERMMQVFSYYKVQTIYHAAAYKHVPLVESNQSEGVLNNAIGTWMAAEAAIAASVENFVLISTDKAVRPTNVMGASKRVAELTLQALSKLPHSTCLTMVRFGNVLDSSGSVIPLFKKQIKKGGPITVTHEDIVRYFMTIPEAVELVIQAGTMAEGGEVFLLNMGEPIRIYDLAVKMINLSGLKLLDENNPEGDIEIKFTGLRPGEKLYEELLVGNKSTTTENKLIMCAEEEMINWDKLEPMLNEIKEFSEKNQTKKIYNSLKKIVPEFNSNYISSKN